MNFMSFCKISKNEDLEQSLFNRGSEYREHKFEIVYEDVLHHQIFHWIEKNVAEVKHEKGSYFEFTKDDVKKLSTAMKKADAEKTSGKPEPWKHLPIPDQNGYRFHVEKYEKEYDEIYYKPLRYTYEVLDIILKLFDFDNYHLIVFVD